MLSGGGCRESRRNHNISSEEDTMKNMINNHGGFAIVYGLVVLLLVTVSGTAILFLTQKDRVAVADYASIRSSSQAALAALKAFEGQCQKAPDTALAILKKYSSDHEYKWLLGSSSAVANIEQKILFGSGANAPKYSARILGFDEDNSFIIIEGIGYDGNGGKKKVVASYQLDGIVMSVPAPIKVYGLYLGGTLGNCNSTVNITGDVYLSMDGSTNPQHFNQGGTITGNLKTGNKSNVLDISSNLTVTGKAFIRCPLMCNNAFRVNDKAGFEKEINPLNQQMQLFGDAFFNSTYPSSWNSNVNMNGHAVKYNPALPVAKFTNTSSATSASGIDIATELGMAPGDEYADSVIMPTWPGGVVKNVSGSISASDVETWWTQKQTAGKLYQNEWLVLELNGDVSMNGGGPFAKKVIWITGSHVMNVNGNWYDCADGSITMIYVNGSGYINGLGVPANKKFRGYVFENSTSSNGISYQFGSNTTFYGAIHHGKGNFNLNSGPLNLVFNAGSLGQTAIQELVDLGLIIPSGSTTVLPPGLNLVDLRIRPTMLGMQM